MMPSWTGGVQQFWTDVAVRHEAFQTISDAYAASNQTVLWSALVAVDQAVASGMAAFGFPRAPVTAITVESLPGLAWYADAPDDERIRRTWETAL